MPPETLNEFLTGLMASDLQLLPTDETWEQSIERTTIPGTVQQIAEETWDYFLDVLPPRWMGPGAFALAEGVEPWRLFWRRQGKFYCSQMTWDETRHFVWVLRGGDHVPRT